MNWRPGGAQREKAVTPPESTWIIVNDPEGMTGMFHLRHVAGDCAGRTWFRKVRWWLPLDELLATLPEEPT